MDESRVVAPDSAEQERLKQGILAGFSIPLIDDVEDYVFEVILCHMKSVPLIDPIEEGRKKLLFDVVAPDGRGWSVKTLKVSQKTLQPGGKFEFVIQRANIFKKAHDLGFKHGLTRESRPPELGRALILHWNKKFEEDSAKQKVTKPLIAMLLKDKRRRKFAFVEMPYHKLDPDDYIWDWSKKGGAGLKACDKHGTERFKWYFGQTQFFEVLTVPNNAVLFGVDWRRHSLNELMRRTLLNLDGVDELVKGLKQIVETTTDTKSRKIAEVALAKAAIEVEAMVAAATSRSAPEDGPLSL